MEASEGEVSLATKSREKFNAGKYEEALDGLHKLAAEMSPIKDFRLLHNIALTEYVMGKCSCIEFQAALQNISPSLENSQFHDHGSSPTSGTFSKLDEHSKLYNSENESALLKHNLAALKFQQKQYASAAKLLESLFRNIEPIDEVVAMHICFLYMDTLLHSCRACTHSSQDREQAVSKLQSILGFLEKPHSFNGQLTSENSGSDTEKPKEMTSTDLIEFRFRFHLYKSKTLLLQENVKAAKKEVKSALEIFQKEIKSKDSNDEAKVSTWRESPLFGHCPPVAVENSAALYLKANLEYLRQNYKKCIKLLASCQKGSYPERVFLNNMGCIHYQMQRRKCAQSYYAKALEACSKPEKEVSGMERTLIKTPEECEILYNNGLQLLMRGKYPLAFRCFYTSSRMYFNRPRLWLGMGECCMMQYVQQTKKAHSGYTNSLVRGVVGSGQHRRVLLPLKSKSPPNLIESGDNGNKNKSAAEGVPRMSLQFAAKCFRNVLALTAPRQNSETTSSSTTTSDTSRISSIRQAALANLSYVCLCMHEPQLALESAQTLLAMVDCTNSYRYLARTYCAEALSMQSRPSEALEKLTSDACFPDRKTGALVEDYCKSCPDDPSSRVALHINLANVYILQNNFPQAEQCVTRALGTFPTSMEALRLLVYILLRKGSTKKALQVLKEGRMPLL